VDHGLFVSTEVILQAGILFESLSNSSDIAVTENSEDAFNEAVLLAIARGMLLLQITDNRLCNGQAALHGVILLAYYQG
jgi:hypothetical protein